MKERKHPRLKEYDYSSAGVYFITLCTRHRSEVLCRIVGRDDPGAPPYIVLSPSGKVAEKYIRTISSAYENVSVDKFVIMPNHVHLLISISDMQRRAESSRPTVSRIIGAFKRFSNKECGCSLWQASFYDHIIRDEMDYLGHWQYIDDNPAKWSEDEYYSCSTVQFPLQGIQKGNL